MRSAVFALLAVLGACGGGSSADDDAGGGGDDCTWQTAPASFSVTSTSAWGGFGGQYRDQPWPVFVVEEARAGECAYFGPANAFCDPPCDGNQNCVAGNLCRPFPTNVSAGHLSVTGTTPPLELHPQAGFNYYTTESYPGLFEPGDEATLAGEGAGAVAPFTVAVRGVPELTVPWTQVTAREGQDLIIPWADAGADSPAGAVVVVHMDSDHHGIQAYVECVAADDGAVTVTAAVLDRLIEAGETGIGTYIENAWIARVHATTTDTASGCVSFTSEARLQMSVETIRQ